MTDAAEITSDTPRPEKARDPAWVERVSRVLMLFAGGRRPPAELRPLVVGWFGDPDDERLQGWLADRLVLRWAQAIEVIDAAEAIADTPAEGHWGSL